MILIRISSEVELIYWFVIVKKINMFELLGVFSMFENFLETVSFSKLKKFTSWWSKNYMKKINPWPLSFTEVRTN